ncbi:MAG: hypothetical protein K0S66_2330 [Sphingomonas sp.]|jgi:acetyl-CoA carboxylase alpha subunit|nr:hypothetical protein [Sphingomonas sp.]
MAMAERQLKNWSAVDPLAKEIALLTNRMVVQRAEYLKSELLVKAGSLELERVQPNADASVRRRDTFRLVHQSCAIASPALVLGRHQQFNIQPIVGAVAPKAADMISLIVGQEDRDRTALNVARTGGVICPQGRRNCFAMAGGRIFNGCDV